MTVIDIKDLADLVKKLRTGGGEIRFDGWNATLHGKVAPTLAAELRDLKLQLIYAAVVSCQSKCPTCGGVGRYDWQGYKFCTEHNPTSSLDMQMLAGMKIELILALKHVQQAREDHDQAAIDICSAEYHRVSDAIDKFEKEHLHAPSKAHAAA